MLNLLPAEIRQNYRYARRNTSLKRWIVAPLIALVILIGLGLYGNSIMGKTADSYKSQISLAKQNLKNAQVDKIKSQISDISSNLKLTYQVLSQEVLFSKLLKEVTTVIPPNVVLSGLNINQQDDAIELSAYASDYTSATQLQANLVDKDNNIFQTADLESVDCTKPNVVGNQTFACQVNVRAQFAPNSQFLFITENGAKS